MADKEIKSNLEYEYLRKLYNQYRALLDILDEAMYYSKRFFPVYHISSPVGDSLEYFVRYFIKYFERIDIFLSRMSSQS